MSDDQSQWFAFPPGPPQPEPSDSEVEDRFQHLAAELVHDGLKTFPQGKQEREQRALYGDARYEELQAWNDNVAEISLQGTLIGQDKQRADIRLVHAVANRHQALGNIFNSVTFVLRTGWVAVLVVGVVELVRHIL